MERAERKQLRRKGKNPKAVLGKDKQGQNVARKAVESSKRVEGGSISKKADNAKTNGLNGDAGAPDLRPAKKSGAHRNRSKK
jgi:25S rRNA (cytosine2870-C5)-methyltransferase